MCLALPQQPREAGVCPAFQSTVIAEQSPQAPLLTPLDELFVGRHDLRVLSASHFEQRRGHLLRGRLPAWVMGEGRRRTACVTDRMEATVPVVTVGWTPEERARVEEGIARYPPESGRCAALARIVHRLAHPKDQQTRGIQLQAVPPARWLNLKRDHPRTWNSHTLVETMGHRVDALTGADGCTSGEYLGRHFKYHEHIQVVDVDVFTVDAWIEEEEAS